MVNQFFFQRQQSSKKDFPLPDLLPFTDNSITELNILSILFLGRRTLCFNQINLMKKLFLNLRVLTLLIFLSPLVSNAQIWVEDFDGSNATNPPAFSLQCSDDRDYIDIVCQNGGGCANPINSVFVLNGATGQYLGIRDTDHSPCTTTNPDDAGFIDFNGIDITACSGLSYLCFSVAESRNMGGSAGGEWGTSNGRDDTWDGDSRVSFFANIDGAGYSTVTSIVNTFRVGGGTSRSDGRPGIDTNCSGISGEAGEPEITDTFTEYCFELPADGAVLDLRIDFQGLQTGGEDIAIDNISVHCGTPPSGTVLPSCSPFVTSKALFYDDFDGGNIGGAFTFRGCQTPGPNVGKRDYFDIMCAGGCSPNTMSTDYTYFGLTGKFLGVRDMDTPCGGGGSANNQFVDANGIDISSCGPTDKLYVCFDMAESDVATNNNPTREAGDSWDNDSFVKFNASVDGGAKFPVAAFEAVGGSNSGPAIDTNCDGSGDGPQLTATMTSYCFEIAATGNTLNLEIHIGGLNTDGEDVAIDNVTVLCTDDLFCLPAFLQQSCTAPIAMNVPTMGEWALFILFLLMINLASVFMMAMQSRTKLTTPNGQTVSMANVLRSASFNKQAFMNALKHAFGLAIVGFAIIYIGWGEIVFADIIGMMVSIPLVAYFIHLFYTKE